jgi:hypothetical protein
MFSNLLQFLDILSKKILDTFARFPLVSFLAFILTLILVIFADANHPMIKSYPNFDIANKVAFTLTLAIPFFLVLRLISNKRMLTLFGMVFTLLYYILLPNSFGEEEIVMQRHLLFILALLIFIFPAPFLFRSVKNTKFWEWMQQIIFAFISALLFGLILYLGLQGGLYAFEKLFSIEINHSFSKQLALIIFGIFSFNYFLAQIPNYPLLLPLRSYSKVENIFTKYILTPLSIAYFLLLYFYTFKLIYLAELPSGLLAWLILIFSAVALITFLLWTPLWSEKTEKYKKWIWIAILIQTLVLGLSIYLRIEQYGFTQNRYFISIIGIWLLLISLYFIFYKHARYTWMFVSFSLLLLFTQVGTLSVYNVSKKSQLEQLSTLLKNHPNLSEESNATVRYRISSTIEYLYTQHGIDTLLPLLPEVVNTFKLQEHNPLDCNIANSSYFPQYATESLGFKHIDKWQWKQLNMSKIKRSLRVYSGHSDNMGFSIKGYEWLQNFSYANYQSKDFCPTETIKTIKKRYTILTTSRTINIQKDSKELALIKIEHFLQSIKQKIKSENKKNNHRNYYRGSKLTQEQLTYTYTNKKIMVQVYFTNLFFKPNGQLSHYQGVLLIQEKK